MVTNDKYEDFLNFGINKNLHPSLTKIYKDFPDDITHLKNLIFYGPPGVGKYTQMLSIYTLLDTELQITIKHQMESCSSCQTSY